MRLFSDSEVAYTLQKNSCLAAKINKNKNQPLF